MSKVVFCIMYMTSKRIIDFTYGGCLLFLSLTLQDNHRWMR